MLSIGDMSHCWVIKSCIQWRFDTQSNEEVLQNIADHNYTGRKATIRILCGSI